MTSLRRPSRGSSSASVLGLAGDAVLLEGVAAQQRAERQVGREHLRARLAGVGGLGDDARRLALARADLGIGVAAEQQPVQLLGGLARAEQRAAAGRRCRPAPGSRSRVLALPVKSAARAALDSAPFMRSSRPRAVGAQRQLLAGEQHERPRGRGRQGWNWISRSSDIDRVSSVRLCMRSRRPRSRLVMREEGAARPALRIGECATIAGRGRKRKQTPGDDGVRPLARPSRCTQSASAQGV